VTPSCAFKYEFAGSPALSPWKDRAVHLLIPLVRAYTRYGPGRNRRKAFWEGPVQSYFAWHSHPFTARTVFGRRMRGNTQEILQQAVYYFGVWEPNLTRWIAGRLAPGDTFIDVGANFGYFSLLAEAVVGGDGSVVAIEASPATFDQLTENLRINRAANVRTVNLAASDVEGVLPLYRGDEFNRGSSTTLATQGKELECEVRAAALDDVLTDAEIERTRLVKIDVEGAEASVVAGMERLLERGRPDLEVVVEVHAGLNPTGRRPEEVFPMFAEAGFHPYRLDIDYSPAHWLSADQSAPVRIDAPVDVETDVVFSRRDAETLLPGV
jgi:FkbM family methyltransferase